MQGDTGWLTRDQARTRLGLPARQFARLLACNLITTTGKGLGMRCSAADVEACLVLWARLRPLLPPAKGRGEDEDEDED